MNEANLRRLTGVLLVLTPIAFNVFFTLLSVTFEYPDILREPTGHVLRRFDAGGSSLVAMWYGFMLTAVLFVPLAVLVHKILARQDTPYMAVATAFGIVGGREPRLPLHRPVDPVGRCGHVRVAAAVQEVVEFLGVVSPAGIVVGMLEPAGFEPAANIVVVGYILWSLWLAIFGILISLPSSIRNRALQGNPAGNSAHRRG